MSMKRNWENNGQRVRQELLKKDAVIFDLDGTLVDSMWMWKAIDIEYLRRYGHECPDFLQREIEGMSFSETAVYFKETFRLPDTVEEIIAEWMDMVLDQYQNRVPMKPGLKDFLKYVHEKGIRLGIASSNHADLVRAALEGHKIGDFFAAIVTCSEVAHPKPEPDVYLEAARRIQVPAEKCLVFEDIPVGIRAGQSAGMKTCAVRDDYSQEKDGEKRMLADYYIEDYAQILDGTYEVRADQ